MDLSPILVPLVACGALQVADQEQPYTSLLHEGTEFGHGHVDQLALVGGLVTAHEDGEVIKDQPLHLLGLDHIAAVREDLVRIDGAESIPKEDAASSQGCVEVPL